MCIASAAPSGRHAKHPARVSLFVLILVLFALFPSIPARAASVVVGDIFMADPDAPTANGAIFHFDSAGVLKDTYQGGNFVGPTGVALNASNDLIIGDPEAFGGAGAIFKVDPDTGTQTTISQAGSFVDPRGVALEASGNIVTTDSDAFLFAGGIIRVSPSTGTQTTLYTSPDVNSAPLFIALESNGDMLITDIGGTTKGVVRVPAGGGVGTQLSSGGSFLTPEGIAVASNGDIYVADNGNTGSNGRIIKVNPTTGAQTLIASGSPLSCPVGIAIDAGGFLIIGDPCYEPGAVIRVDPSTGTKTVLWNSGVSPQGIAIARTVSASMGSGGGGGGSSCPQPSVVLARPNGGETFTAGAVEPLFWSAGGCQASSLRLSLSVDGGTTYDRSVAELGSFGTGHYAWTVPDIPTRTARIKAALIGSGGVGLASDASDGDFEIVGTAPSAPSEPSNGADGTGTEPPEPSVPTDVPAPSSSGAYDPETAAGAAPDIDADKDVAEPPEAPAAPCVGGSLIKGSGRAVYYCGKDGKRYSFPNVKVYLSWYPDFSTVVTVSDELLALVPLGGNVTYRPGVRLLKIQTDPRVYAVSRGGVLRWVPTEAMAASLYGTDWNTKVDDVPVEFFANYIVGDALE